MIFRFCLIIDRIRKVHLIEHLNPNFTETLFKIFVIKLQKHEVVYTCTLRERNLTFRSHDNIINHLFNHEIQLKAPTISSKWPPIP